MTQTNAPSDKEAWTTIFNPIEDVEEVLRGLADSVEQRGNLFAAALYREALEYIRRKHSIRKNVKCKKVYSPEDDADLLREERLSLQSKKAHESCLKDEKGASGILRPFFIDELQENIPRNNSPTRRFKVEPLLQIEESGSESATSSFGNGVSNASSNNASDVPDFARRESAKSAKSCGAWTTVSSVAFSPKSCHAITPRAQRHFPQIKELMELCKPKSGLKKIATECFKNHAEVREESGELGLDAASFAQFIYELADEVDVPPEIFGDHNDEFIRFDFSGTGNVTLKEAYKFARYHIKDYAKELAPSIFAVTMPHMTLAEAGYQVVQTLGQGAFGEVKLALNQEGEARAVKCCQKSETDVKALEELKEEFGLMKAIDHTNIAKTFDMFQDDEFYMLVNEPYYGGDFVTLVAKAKEQGVQMTETWWRSLFRQCFEGISYLNRHATMHCDIKEPNIMLKTTDCASPHVVIVDYGLVQGYAKNRVKLCGTPGYIPPETWQSKKWYPKGDVFSMGVIMVQLLTNRTPIIGSPPKDNPSGPRPTLKYGLFTENCTSMMAVAEATLRRPLPVDDLPKAWSDDSVEVIQRILKRGQKNRPTVNAVLQDVWFVADSVSDEVWDPTLVQPRKPSTHRPLTRHQTAPIKLPLKGEDDESVPAPRIPSTHRPPTRHQTLPVALPLQAEDDESVLAPRTPDSMSSGQTVCSAAAPNIVVQSPSSPQAQVPARSVQPVTLQLQSALKVTERRRLGCSTAQSAVGAQASFPADGGVGAMARGKLQKATRFCEMRLSTSAAPMRPGASFSTTSQRVVAQEQDSSSGSRPPQTGFSQDVPPGRPSSLSPRVHHSTSAPAKPSRELPMLRSLLRAQTQELKEDSQSQSYPPVQGACSVLRQRLVQSQFSSPQKQNLPQGQMQTASFRRCLS